MEINKESILNKTHYGLHIYSLVLRYYYPGETALSLSGKCCKPTKNPFNENKFSLIISINNYHATHKDLDNSIPEGDAIDFARLHFKKDDKEIFSTINKSLNLHIGEKIVFYNNQKKISRVSYIPSNENTNQITIPKCSYYKGPITNIYPSGNIDLLTIYKMIKGNSFYKCTEKLRLIKNTKQAQNYKARHFNYVTFSGIFFKRNEKALLSHSGLLTIDFDHINNISKLKKNLLNDEYFDTELLFVSPSGNGLKWIISIDLKQATHAQNFQAIANYLRYTYDIEIDKSGKDISRACFLPCDNEIYINPKYLHHAKKTF